MMRAWTIIRLLLLRCIPLEGEDLFRRGVPFMRVQLSNLRWATIQFLTRGTRARGREYRTIIPQWLSMLSLKNGGRVVLKKISRGCRHYTSDSDKCIKGSREANVLKLSPLPGRGPATSIGACPEPLFPACSGACPEPLLPARISGSGTRHKDLGSIPKYRNVFEQSFIMKHVSSKTQPNPVSPVLSLKL